MSRFKVGDEVVVRVSGFINIWSEGVIDYVCNPNDTPDYDIRLKNSSEIVGCPERDVRAIDEHLTEKMSEEYEKMMTISDTKVYASHYKDGIQTREKKSMVAKHLDDILTNDAWDDISNAMKYFDRMGLKDDAEKDAYKCADYLHRAITGKFLNEVK